MAQPLSRAQLASQHTDTAWVDKLRNLFDIVTILRESIILKNYKISDALNSSIQLSGQGRKVRDFLVTKRDVPPKEANLLTFLALVHVDPLVDIDKIDLNALISAISEDVKSGALLYPLIYGRDLYDRAAELFPDERRYLKHEDTIKLLENQPRGVFQAGRFILGPLGILTVPIERALPPSTSIPLQHCPDHSCRLVHNVQLTTSIDAPINKHRPSLNEALDEISKEPSDWRGFLLDVDEATGNPFDESVMPPIVHTLGECLDDDELRTFFASVLDRTQGRVRAVVETQCQLRGRSEQIAEHLDRAEILQLLLTENDESMQDLIDGSVREGIIHIPEGEVRRPKINRRRAFGTWGYTGQLGPHGYRAVGDVNGLPLLRLAQLCRELFDGSDPHELDALAWILRRASGATPVAKLEEFLRTETPHSVVRTLVLARKKNADFFCRMLRIPAGLPDEVFVEAVMWKLGFPSPPLPDKREDYWREHSALERVSTTAAVNLSLNAGVIRSTAANYFVELEHYLSDSLTFTTWSLLNDHYLSSQPFVFRVNESQIFSQGVLGKLLDPSTNIPFTDKPTLFDLVKGFQTLAAHLEDIRSHPDKYVRSAEQFPKYAHKTRLQGFPFEHTIPFLDLTAESQLSIVTVLKEVSSDLNDSGIMTVRNDLLHANREQPAPKSLIDSLNDSRQALEKLEGIGCVRSTYRLVSHEVDSWGRANTRLQSVNGREISFSSPSYFQWVSLPALGSKQYLVHGAVFAPPNYMLRFRRGFDSNYEEYWREFPKRRERGNISFGGTSEGMSTPLETGAHVGSRAD